MSVMLRANNMLFRLLALVLALSNLEHCIARRERQQCNPSFCGTIANISHPFRLKKDPAGCGLTRYELVCDNNQTTLYLQKRKFYVKEISYDNQTIRVVDATLNEDKCIINPHYSLILGGRKDPYDYFRLFSAVYFLECTMAINSSRYLDVSRCINTSSSPNTYYYALYGDDIRLDDFHEFCIIEAMLPFSLHNNFTAHSVSDFYNEMLMGFQLSWSRYDFSDKIPFEWRLLDLSLAWLRFFFVFLEGYQERGFSYGLRFAFQTLDCFEIAVVGTLGFIIVRALIGIFCLIALVVYKCRRRHLSMDDAIEEFLQSYNNLMPIRYSYSDIKRMTHGFKDKLGQGGFGSVFKGKLRSGHHVAIKLLGNSKANGQDFINEVATIGRIHHVNVVRLIGFCVEGSKQALVYDFMPNGSLDRIIFSRETNINLSWEKTYEVVLGVARGVDYLHKGCNVQILHFDIKPHNILLDENFIPKVSDFGLAKLYPTDKSTVYLTAARGTRGYIAPELFYKNIGGISYKADVYSFGMLLMEMVGRRKNLNPCAEQLSQIYFPSWVYDRFVQGEEIELGDCTDGEKKIIRKMLIVAFWCIQMKPIDRPSMTKVLEMLQGEADELLEMPPKPFVHPKET